jgi:hypothetical protein
MARPPPCAPPDDDSRDVAAAAPTTDTVREPAAGLGRGDGDGDGPSEEGKDSTGSFGIFRVTFVGARGPSFQCHCPAMRRRGAPRARPRVKRDAASDATDAAHAAAKSEEGYKNM